MHRHQREKSSIIGRYVYIFLFITYLVLPSVTTTIAGIVPTINVDPDNQKPGGSHVYMRNDLSINIQSSRYKFGCAWAAFMAVS
jgi:hypothetical protein